MKKKLKHIPYPTLIVALALMLSAWSCSNPSDKTAYNFSSSHQEKKVQLDQLFMDLQHTEDPYETKVIQAEIWELWLDADQKEVNGLMKNGIEAMALGKYEQAVDYFTQATEIKPSFAEAWNKRATSFYMIGEMEAAIHDIEQTLILEDRHFGALSGLAAIYLLEGQEHKALKIYERIARIAPAEPHVQYQIRSLRGKMGISVI